MKYDLTDEEVDRLILGNKKLHIELATTKVELERLRKALAADVFRFSPERAQEGTATAIEVTIGTVVANRDQLIQVIMRHFGAPGEKQAVALLGMVGRVLLALEQMVRNTSIEEIKDGQQKLTPKTGTRH